MGSSGFTIQHESLVCCQSQGMLVYFYMQRTSSPNSATSSLRTSSDDCLNPAKRTSYSSPLASRIQSHQSRSPIAMGSSPLLSAKGDRMKNKKHSPATSRSTSVQEEIRHFSRVEQSKTAERTLQLKSKILRATGEVEEEKKVVHTSSTSRSSKDPKNRQETERRRESPAKKPKIVEKILGSPLGNVQISSSQPTDLQKKPSLVIPVKEASTQGSRSGTVVSANLQFQGRAGLAAGHSEKATVSELCPERREEGQKEEVSDIKEMVPIPIVDDNSFEIVKIPLEDVSTRSTDLEGRRKESKDEEERRAAGESKEESHHARNKILTSASGGKFKQSNLASDVQLGQPTRCGTPKGLDCVVELEEEKDLETYISLSVERSETLGQAGPATTLEKSHNKEEVVKSILRKRQRTEEDHAGLPSDLKVHKTGCSPTLGHDPGSAGGERLEMKGRTEICVIAEGQAHSACSGHSDVTQPSQTPDDVADSSWNSRERPHMMEITSTQCRKALFDEGDIETSDTRLDLQKTEGYDFNQGKVDEEREFGSMNPMPAAQPSSPLLCELGKSEGSSALGGKRLEEDRLGDGPLEGLGHNQELLTAPSTENKLQTTNRISDSKLDKGSFDKSVGEEGGSGPGREDKMEVIDSSAHLSDWSKHHSTEKHCLEGRDKESCGTEKANEGSSEYWSFPYEILNLLQE